MDQRSANCKNSHKLAANAHWVNANLAGPSRFKG